MASVGDEEVEYESDPEEAKLSLTMRRREASDDEEEEEEREEDGDERESPARRIDSRAGIVSDGDSDGQGAAAEYDDDDDDDDDEKESEIDEEEEVEVEEEEYEERGVEEGVSGGGGGGVVAVEAVEVVAELAAENGEGSAEEVEEEEGVNQVGGEEKKENEPFAVPTAGAFYMHDDRFRDNSGARNRRTLGGRRLWESKDDRKWGHDKFEEMTSQERHYEEGRRNSRGPYRGRGKSRGADRENQRGNRSKAYNNNNQNHAPKNVRGRGPRRYEPAFRNNNEASPTQNKQYGKFVEKTSHGSSGRAPGPTSNNEPNPVPTGKHVFASSLSSASPPFYPSASSNKEVTLTQKRDVQAIPANRNFRPTSVDENFSMSQSNSMLEGKEIAGTVPPVAGKSSTNYRLPPSGSSLNNSAQFSQSRVQGRDPAPSGKMNFQSTTSHNQVNRVSPPSQINSVQRNSGQSKVQSQPILQASAQQLGQRPGSGSQALSPSKAALSINSFESGELESPMESSKSKTALVAKVRGTVQGNGRGTFPYAGAQVMAASGNMGGDHNFPQTPAFLPVMSFGNQNPGGIGVPALGMAFPGYVGQPQLGIGNSEMTWLPVLAGAAGGLGASYCPPYITVDGAFHARPSGQASSANASSKETNTDNISNEWKPPQRSELTSDEFGQRQNNARRYSKMNFGQ